MGTLYNEHPVDSEHLSRCIHENGTKMAREPENCQKVARDCHRALYCPKTTCDDVRSVVLVETLLYSEFGTY